MDGADSVWFLFCGTAILAVSFESSTGEDARATSGCGAAAHLCALASLRELLLTFCRMAHLL